MKLRPYQNQALQSARAAFLRRIQSLLLCIPTGGGKTVVFTTIAKGAISRGNKIMIVCDRKELISQAKDNLNRLGLHPTIIAPGHEQTPNNCYLASVDTLRRRELPEVDLVIIDEAHKQTFDNTVIKYLEKGAKVIGATATPVRTGRQRSLDTIYQTIIEPVSIEDLLNDGFLVQCRTFAAKEDFSQVKITGNDYNNAALYHEFNKQKLYEGLIENYERFCPGKKALIFNVNVEHSLNTVEALRSAGYDARHVDGKTPAKERRQLLADFKAGVFPILSNCSVLTTGYDEPSIETIIINRATKSLPLYLQMCGRGSRTYSGKPHFTVIDMGANCYTHGLWSDARTWRLDKKKPRDGVAPVKICENCEAMNAASAKICYDCGTPFKIKKKKLARAEFVEVKSNRGGRERFSPRGKTKEELKEHAQKMGYNPAWVFVQMKINAKK